MPNLALGDGGGTDTHNLHNRKFECAPPKVIKLKIAASASGTSLLD